MIDREVVLTALFAAQDGESSNLNVDRLWNRMRRNSNDPVGRYDRRDWFVRCDDCPPATRAQDGRSNPNAVKKCCTESFPLFEDRTQSIFFNRHSSYVLLLYCAGNSARESQTRASTRAARSGFSCGIPRFKGYRQQLLSYNHFTKLLQFQLSKCQ